MATLDVVIPAYKGKFLRELLQSLAAQTSPEFGVIVCDDASPDPIAEICASFQDKLKLRYVRFESNLGKSDLASQWNRSVRLSSAKWVMLPGDDDVIGPNCVAAFHDAVRANPDSVDVFSFPIRIMDQDGRTLEETKPVSVKNAEEFFEHYTRGTIRPMPVGFIFSRHIFDVFEGFVSFDSGIYSDAATIGQFCSQRGIMAVEGAYAYWRQSEVNISPQLFLEARRWARLSLEFIRWMRSNSDRLGMTREGTQKLIGLQSWNLYRLTSDLPFLVWIWTVFKCSLLLSAFSNRSPARHVFRFMRERWNRKRRLAEEHSGSLCKELQR